LILEGEQDIQWVMLVQSLAWTKALEVVRVSYGRYTRKSQRGDYPCYKHAWLGIIQHLSLSETATRRPALEFSPAIDLEMKREDHLF